MEISENQKCINNLQIAKLHQNVRTINRADTFFRSLKILFTLLIFNFVLSAQNSIPFASQNNAIELSVVNTSVNAAEKVIVQPTNVPQWIQFNEGKTEIKNIQAGNRNTVRFTFSVEKNAPVNQQTILQFKVSNSAGESWTKEIAIQVSPPEKFELYQNYPNPFNPTTTITYTLSPNPSPLVRGEGVRVILKIYDMLGREVATLVNEEQSAGYHDVVWNANTVSSGVYFYKLQAKNLVLSKKMQVVK